MIKQNPLVLALLILFLLTVMAAAAIADASSKRAGPQENLQPDPQQIIRMLTKETPYTRWRMWPGKSAFYEGSRPHGALLTTYVNDVAFAAVENDTGSLPDGAIVVKENYSPQRELISVTAMIKRKGFDPNHGDYYWIAFSPDGEKLESGRINSCIRCHAQAKDHDWIFAFKPEH